MNKVVEFKEKDYLRTIDKKKHSLQFLPASLEELSKVKKISYGGVELKTSYIIDIVHNLLLKYYFKKDNSFNLSATILKEKYGHIYNYYMDYLVKNEFIILVRKHQKGKNSRIYKLNEKIIKGEIKRYKNQDNVLLKKYRNAISIVDSPHYGKGILTEVKKKLVNDLFSINIDYVKSIFFLDSTNQDNDIYNKNKYSVECIKDNHIFYHFDDYGRMHTNFTILKSFIRKNCLLIDGEETCEIDIPNSQPLFLYKLIKDNDIFIVKDEELELFRILTASGKFYQYLLDNCGSQMSRKEIKEVVYKVLFGRNYKNNADNLFKKLFPTIHTFIKSYKKEMGDYRMLSYNLQRAESNLIFNRIIKTIMELDPNIKLITVHDSIICARKHKEAVEIVFNTLLKDEFDY
jgi:hypothetical protein